MVEETKNPPQDNSNVSTEVQEAETKAPATNLSNVLDGMTEKQPEAKPENDTKGEKVDGSGTQEEQNKGKEEDKLPSWTSQLSEEIKGNDDLMKQLGKFNKISDLAKSYAELEKTLGERVKLPGKDASEADLNNFYEKLGKPKSKDEYSFSKNDNLGFAEMAFKNNLSKVQAENIFKSLEDFGNNVVNAQKAQAQQMLNETDKMLHDKYGNKYNEKIALMKRGIEAYGGKELGQILNNAGVLYNPSVVNMFITLGEQNAEAGSVTKGTNGGTNQYKSTVDGGSFSFKL